METIDIVIIVLTLLASLFVGLYAQWLGTKKKEGSSETGDYFLSGRDMTWPCIGASIFVSNIGAEHFMGISGAACQQGIAVALYEWWAVPILLMLGFVFFPVYIACGITSIPEFLQQRYDHRTRLLVSVIMIIFYIFTKISVTLYAGTLIVNQLLDVNVYLSAFFLVALTGLYTIFGGLRAVIWTDTLQMIVFVVGGLAGLIVCLSLVTYQNVLDYVVKYDPRYLHLWHHSENYPDDTDFEWSGMLLGANFCAVYYWCFDQNMVQRGLAAKSVKQARCGCMAAALFKLLPPFLMIIPGIVARTMYEMCRQTTERHETDPNVEILHPAWCADATQELHTGKDSNRAYVLLVTRAFPSGIKGLVVSAMLAAMLSTLSSAYNSSSTLFTMDIYKEFINCDASQRHYLNVGRSTVAVLAGLTFAILPILNQAEKSLFVFTQAVSSHFTPPLVMICLLGLFWPRATQQGAFIALISSFTIGMVHLVVQLSKPDVVFLSYNHVGTVLFFFPGIVCVVVSLMTEPPLPEKINECIIPLPWSKRSCNRQASPNLKKSATSSVDDALKNAMPVEDATSRVHDAMEDAQIAASDVDDSIEKGEAESREKEPVNAAEYAQLPLTATWEKVYAAVLLCIIAVFFIYFK